MPQTIVLRDAEVGSSARIAPQLGFNCFEFLAVVGGQVVSVIDSAPDFPEGRLRPSGHGIPVLFPYPNRIRNGEYSWYGRPYKIPLTQVLHDSEGNAIHGLCVDRPWRVVQTGPTTVTGEFQLSVDAPERISLWPADFVIQIRYELLRSSLRADISIRNPSSRPLPWGFGTHPYFKLPLGSGSRVGECTVEAPVTQQWELVNCLPTGRRIPIPEEKNLADAPYADLLKIDDVFTGMQPRGQTIESVITDEKAGLQVVQSTCADFREFVVCMREGRDAICLEPYTCATDAINLQSPSLDAGLRVLTPGAEQRLWFQITVGPVVA